MNSKVAIIGLGGIGSWIAYTLTGAGIGKIIGIDPDNVESSNLNRQILYSEESIGRPKVECAGQRLQAFNSELEYVGIKQGVNSTNSALNLLNEADFVILSADHPPRYLRRWVAEACAILKIPYIILGGTLLGPLVDPYKTACFGCYEALLREKEPEYDNFVDQLVNAQPTQTSASFMSAIIAGLIAKDVILFLSKAAKPLTLGQVVRFDMDNATSKAMKVYKRNDCKFCGDRRYGEITV